MYVPGENGDPLGVNSTEIGILEERTQKRLRGLLESKDGGGLETQVGLEILGNLTDKTLEGQLADKQLRAFLVLANLADRNSTRSPSMLFLQRREETYRVVSLGLSAVGHNRSHLDVAERQA